MDLTVLFNLTYGLYVVGAIDNDRPVGCIINTCFQVTSENPILAISINKNNNTYEAIRKSGRFSLSIIVEDTDSNIIPTFGFRSSRDCNKYESFGFEVLSGTPIVNGKFAGRLILDVIEMIDNGTHFVVLSRLNNVIKGEGNPMTYDYYHKVIKGNAPKNAPTYQAPETKTPKSISESKTKKYVCDVCGYVLEAETLADDYICPCCKMDRTHFIEE